MKLYNEIYFQNQMLKNAQLIIALLNDAEYCSCAFFPENYSNGRNGISQKRI